MAGVLDDVFPWLLNQEDPGGNPYAVSPRGAFGPAQLMPATAANPGYGVPPAQWAGARYNGAIPGDVEENKRVGKGLLGSFLQASGGDVPEALMRYNWGPGHVDKWKALGSPENLVPSETKNYVQKIMAHVMPQDAQTSNVAAKGDSMAPQQVSNVMPTNNTPSDKGFDLGSVLKSQGGWGSLGPSLLALGAGIAAGGAPGGGGWGAGLGKGFAGANEIQQRGLENKLQLATLMNALSNQQFEHGIQGQQLDLSKATNSEHQGETNNSINLITSAAQPYQAAKAGLSSWDPVKFSAATGPMTQAVLGYAKLTGQDPKPLLEAMVPKFGEHQADIDAKARAFEGTMSGLGGEGGIASTNPLLAKSAEGLKAYGSPAGTAPTQAAPTGTGTPAVQAGAAASTPLRLTGKPGLHYSPSRKQYKDANGNIYDQNGDPVNGK